MDPRFAAIGRAQCTTTVQAQVAPGAQSSQSSSMQRRPAQHPALGVQGWPG
ncbi:MAG TPA: hypothetical protein VN033_02615 [Vulgatibacter sp.]|nr:hypothetical protein [Vulgatibacter sp.]